MSFLDKFFGQFFSPWFSIDGITYGILDIMFLSLPLCIIGGIVLACFDSHRNS